MLNSKFEKYIASELHYAGEQNISSKSMRTHFSLVLGSVDIAKVQNTVQQKIRTHIIAEKSI